MKKWTYHHVFLCLWGLCWFSLILYGVSMLCGIHFIFGSYGSSELLYISISSVILLPLVWCICYISKRPQHIILRIFVIIVLCAAIAISLPISFSLYILDCAEYVTFPGENHTIVVAHQSFIFNSWGTVYEKTSPITMKEVGKYSLDDYYSPDRFCCTWCDTYFEIDFGPTAETFEYLK